MPSNNKGASKQDVAKAGIWYTICNFLFKGMAFITTPIFTRLLSKNELGIYSNYTAWIAILTVLTSLDLAQSVIRSKLEHEDDIDSYIWSTMFLSTLWTLLVYIIVIVFKSFFINLFQVDMVYIHVMFIYLLVSPAYTMLITKHRAFYKYKMFVALTGLITVSGTALSLVMVIIMQNKLAGRIIGYYMPFILFSIIIYIYLAYKGRKIKLKYWKYACIICIPLVPHVLSMYLLSSSDRIIIANLCGVEYTAIYSVAYSAYHICTLLFESMNKAWAPWLLESLHSKKYAEIQKVSKIYIGVFIIPIIGILVMIPEIILILGGKQYMDAIYCLPPLVTSCVFQFIYTMYVNIEFYQKKTFGVSIATMLATVINIVLNLVLIPLNPEHSYIIAAYTTLAGYIVLFILHYSIVRKMNMSFVYDIRYILFVLFSVFAFSLFANVLYSHTVMRYFLVTCYSTLVLYVMYYYRYAIYELFANKRRKK